MRRVLKALLTARQIPSSLVSLSVTDKLLGHADLSVVAGADPAIASIGIYRAPTGLALNVGLHFVTTITYTGAGTYNYTDGDNTPTTTVTNGTFAADATWAKGTGWTIAAGVAAKAAGVGSNLSEAATLTVADVIRTAYDIVSISGGSFRVRLGGGTAANGTLRSTTGTWVDRMTVNSGNNTLLIAADATVAGTIDNVIAYKETVTCAPQGTFDYYAVPLDSAGRPGPATVAASKIII